MSAHSTPRKRGRPPITKNYENPMESPMAHSSIAVQKLGKPNFIKPMMKVDMITPKKRKQSASSPTSFSSSLNSIDSSSHTHDDHSPLLTHSGRYRGVILNTPMKNNNNHTNNISLTPDSSSLMSTPRHPTIKNNHNHNTEPISNINSQESSIFSSAKISYPTNSPIKNHFMDSYLQPSTQITPSTSAKRFSLSLNINSSGKASIGPELFNKSQANNNEIISKSNDHVTKLLKQMNYNKLKSNDERQDLKIESSLTTTQEDDHILKIPKTPKFNSNNSNAHTLKTGFTPIFTLDQLLSPSREIPTTNSPDQRHQIPPHLSLPSDAIKTNNKNNFLTSKLAFKTANDGGDPILINDDTLAVHTNTNSTFTSPKVILPTFNTPPSFMNLGSPNGLLFSPFNRKRNSSILMPETSNNLMENVLKTTTTTTNSNNNNNNINNNINNNSKNKDKDGKKRMDPPKTPKFNDEMLVRNNIFWSPYIQTLMENNKLNSNSNKYIHDIFSPPQQHVTNDDLLPHIDPKSDSNTNNGDDARLALKNLINDA